MKIKVKETRQNNANKFTQKDMANTLNLSERQYRRIEQGISKPDVWTAIRIAQALGTTVEKLFLINT